MASTRVLTRAPCLSKPNRRTFVQNLPNPFASSEPTLQTLSASRILPYPSTAIYAIIADVSAYQNFLPFCSESRVTRWSSPDNDGKKWPSEADISVGWGGINETFQSRIYCVPGSIVEAVGGKSETQLPRADIQHHEAGEQSGSQAASSSRTQQTSQILTHLQSRWTLKPFHFRPAPLQDRLQGKVNPQSETTGETAREQTEVQLSLNFAFANPLYQAMSSAVTQKVAGLMIEAFEKRVKEVIEGPGHGGTDKKVGMVDGTVERGRA